jgi:hypothetical protein
MRVLITVLIAISAICEGAALPIAIRDGVAMRRAFEVFNQRPGSQADTIASVLKARHSFLIEQDVRGLAEVVTAVIPKPRPWLSWLAGAGVVVGGVAAILAVWV